MSLPNTSEKSVYLDREEHDHKGAVGAKRVVLYAYDALTDSLTPFVNPLRTVQSVEYYASAAGGRLAYNITTNVVTITGSAEQPLALLENPTGSGKDIYLDLGEFASSVNTQFRRYSTPIINTRGTANLPRNMSGGATASALRFYPAGQFTLTNNGTVTKTAHIAAYQQYITEIKGKVILRPGQAVYWTIDQPSGGSTFTASIYFEYWELPTVA